MIDSDPPPWFPANLPGAAEEPLGTLHGLGVESAGQGPPAPRHHAVVGAGQAGQRIDDQHHVLPHFHPAPGSLLGQLGHRDVLRRRVVEARRNHLADAGRLDLEDFLRPLVHQEDEQHRLRDSCA